MDALEPRLFLSATPIPPHVMTAVADNRGQVVLTLDQPLRPATVNKVSVQLLSGGKRLAATIQYSPTTKSITVTAQNLPADAAYSVRLVAARLRGVNGQLLDGENRGPRRRSGDGRPGGDYVAISAPAAKQVARFTTSLGDIDVRLFSAQTPQTVANFLSYANEGAWDGTFFHRSVKNFVVQGGGYSVNKDGQVDNIAQKPAVVNEPHPGSPGNIRGTIAMAKLPTNPDSATNEWFFNLGDNRANLDSQNGGFTVFGQVSGRAGLATMDRIAAKGTVNVTNTPFEDLPVVDVAKVEQAKGVDPKTDLIYVKRLAILVDLKAPAVKTSPAR